MAGLLDTEHRSWAPAFIRSLHRTCQPGRSPPTRPSHPANWHCPLWAPNIESNVYVSASGLSPCPSHSARTFVFHFKFLSYSRSLYAYRLPCLCVDCTKCNLIIGGGRQNLCLLCLTFFSQPFSVFASQGSFISLKTCIIIIIIININIVSGISIKTYNSRPTGLSVTQTAIWTGFQLIRKILET